MPASKKLCYFRLSFIFCTEAAAKAQVTRKKSAFYKVQEPKEVEAYLEKIKTFPKESSYISMKPVSRGKCTANMHAVNEENEATLASAANHTVIKTFVCAFASCPSCKTICRRKMQRTCDSEVCSQSASMNFPHEERKLTARRT